MKQTFFLSKLYLYICFFLILNLGGFYVPCLVTAEDNPEKELKIKKMVMMLAIVSKEYGLAVKDGQVINSVEYEESQAFLGMVTEKFISIVDQFKNPADGELIKNQLDELKFGIQQKDKFQKLKILSSSIQNKILSEFEIKIQKSPKRAISLKNGEKIYNAKCAQCHGTTGKGNGPSAAELDPKPAILADPEITGNEHSTPYDNFEVINVGIANTAMIAWADKLSEDDIWDVAYYIRTFSNKNILLPDTKVDPSENKNIISIHETVDEIRKLIKTSLDSFKDSNPEGASDAAFDAYLIYENIESALIAKQKDLGLRLQANFGRLRGEIKRNAPKLELDAIAKMINTDLDLAVQVFTKKEESRGVFIQSFSIIVREGFETILILSALITFLIKSRNENLVKIIYLGAAIGVLASILTAYIIHEILDISSANQEILEGTIMLIAAAMLFYISYWLISKVCF